MRNRAKCKKCNSIIESIHGNEWVYCACSEIGLSGGKDKYRCMANDFNNFVRVDDEDNEILVKIKDPVKTSRPSKKELIQMLDEMIKQYEDLPQVAKINPINHYDFSSLMILLSAIFRSCNEES